MAVRGRGDVPRDGRGGRRDVLLLSGPSVRLDLALLAAGLAPTRAQARDAILRGVVTVDGNAADRPAQRVPPGAALSVAGPVRVGRGGLKLAHALEVSGVDPAGRRCLDVGASTGGFTEVLLSRGAAHVVALDVGRDQLAPSLAADPRVTRMDGVNARHLGPGDLPWPPDLVVADVSFISLTLVLPPVLALAAPRAAAVVLVKPQFEVGRAAIGKGGIVRDVAAADAAVARIVATLAGCGFLALPPIPSPVAGGDGNREVLLAAMR